MSELDPLSIFLKDRETKSGDLASIDDIRKQKLKLREDRVENKRQVHNERCKVTQNKWLQKKKEEGSHSITVYPALELVKLLDEFIAENSLQNRTVALNYILDEFFNKNNNK